VRSQFVRFALPSLVLLLSHFAFASPQETSVQPNAKQARADESLLTIDRIFEGKDFSEEKLGQLTWSQKSSSYFTFKPSAGEKKGRGWLTADICKTVAWEFTVGPRYWGRQLSLPGS